jgi:hypothetical protein
MATARIARIEGELNPGLDRLLPRGGPPAAGAVTEIKPSESATVTEPELASYLDLDALLEIAGGRAEMPPSPHQCIADFAEPRISDPAIFQGGRPLSILERLASEIIPTFDENEELRSLAGTIIADEIELHRQLAAGIHSVIAS